MRDFLGLGSLVTVLALVSPLGCKTEAPDESGPSAGEGNGPVAVVADAAPATEPANPDAEEADEADVDEPAEGVFVDHVVKDIQGKDVDLKDYRGKAVLIVNTASQCGFTPQYKGLQQLYGQYKDKGLVVLGFPSNDYGAQEPGSNEEIMSFVDDEFGVEFPMMDKIHTKGPEIAPLYATLTQETPEGIAGEVKWNFTKFLIDPEGKIVARFETPVDPLSDEVKSAIEEVLPKTDAEG